MHRAHAAYALFADNDRDLIVRFSPTIDRLARRCAARTGGVVQADDLWSAGALGLLDAAGRFDPTKGVRFETFAEHRIRGAMIDELRKLDHLPRRLRDKADSAKKARAALSMELGRAPEQEEVAARLDLSVDELAGLEGISEPPMHFEPDLNAGSGQPSQHDVFEQRQLAAQLRDAIATLPDRLQTVLGLHYVEGLTYREIAAILEVSEPRVCQLHAEAVKKLRGEIVVEEAAG